MRWLMSLALAVTFASGALVLTGSDVAATTCYYQSETEGQMYKTCWYDCLGEAVARTVRITQLCPLTIKVE